MDFKADDHTLGESYITEKLHVKWLYKHKIFLNDEKKNFLGVLQRGW